MRKTKPIVTRTVGELADVLGLDDTEARYIEIRVRLLARIIKEVRQQELTHVDAARRAQTSRSRMTAILNGNLAGVSTDLLLRIAASLGLRARISFARAA